MSKLVHHMLGMRIFKGVALLGLQAWPILHLRHMTQQAAVIGPAQASFPSSTSFDFLSRCVMTAGHTL